MVQEIHMQKIASCFAGVVFACSLIAAAAGCQPEPIARERIVYREPPPAPPPVYGPVDEAPTTADVDLFRDDLTPYGEWVQTPDYGWVWVPSAVAPDWQPYTVGQWVYSDYGWTWVSEEPWGWATYHYGRWIFIERRGWCWVAGREWGPGWVAWRNGGGYIGWAPLPPRWVGSRVILDLDVSDVVVRGIRPDHFRFVEERFITERRVFEHAVPVTRNVNIINVTQNVTKYERVNNRIVNRSVNVDHIERVTGKTVQRYNITESNAARTSEIRGNEVAMRRLAVPERGRAAGRSAPPERRPEDNRQLEENRQRARAEMDERHRREMEATPPERRPEVTARHERERSAFEAQSQREAGAAAQHRPRGEPGER